MKRKDTETGKVIPDYYMGDIKEQRRYLMALVNGYNAHKQPTEPHIDVNEVIRKCMKRIAKFYGMDNKYRGDGTRREQLGDF